MNLHAQMPLHAMPSHAHVSERQIVRVSGKSWPHDHARTLNTGAYRSIVRETTTAVVDLRRERVRASAVEIAAPRAIDDVRHLQVRKELPVARLHS